jgi:hypothetical protein
MSVSVSISPAFEFGKPKLLFKAPDSFPVSGTPGGLASISRDGQRFALVVPPPRLRQITVFMAVSASEGRCCVNQMNRRNFEVENMWVPTLDAFRTFASTVPAGVLASVGVSHQSHYLGGAL